MAKASSSGEKQDMIKWVTIGIVVVLFVGLFGVLVFSDRNGETETPEGPFAFNDVARIIEPAVTPTVEGETGEATESAETAEVVELVEFVDLQCPTCQAYHPTVKAVIENNPEGVRYIFKHFPLAIHNHARRAALAAEAAGEQGKFFEMVDLLFARQDVWSAEGNPSDLFAEYAVELELDVEQFKADVASDELAARVQENYEEGQEAGVGGTPTFFINGVMVSPNNTPEAFQELIDAARE